MRPEPGTVICRLEDIADGRGRTFLLGPADNRFSVLVLRHGETCVGYVNRCPHFGLALAARDEQLIVEAGHYIKCNTHYARFRWDDGYCDDGDCQGESLDPVALTVMQGVVSLR